MPPAVVLLFIIFFIAPHRLLFAANVHEQTLSDAQLVVDAVNHYRTQRGVAQLTVNSYLSATAQAHADDLASQAYFSHIGHDGSNVLQRATRAGYNGALVGENLAGAADVPMAMQLWIHSDGHRNNMLNTKYVEIGVGIAFDETHQWTVYVTVFGRSAPTALGQGSVPQPPQPLQSIQPIKTESKQPTEVTVALCPASATHYIVRPGDTLAAIARGHQTTWQKLAQLNQLNQPNRLLVGQQLCIPQ